MGQHAAHAAVRAVQPRFGHGQHALFVGHLPGIGKMGEPLGGGLLRAHAGTPVGASCAALRRASCIRSGRVTAKKRSAGPSGARSG